MSIGKAKQLTLILYFLTPKIDLSQEVLDVGSYILL